MRCCDCGVVGNERYIVVGPVGDPASVHRCERCHERIESTYGCAHGGSHEFRESYHRTNTFYCVRCLKVV